LDFVVVAAAAAPGVGRPDLRPRSRDWSPGPLSLLALRLELGDLVDRGLERGARGGWRRRLSRALLVPRGR
jgi:hypothetical protein